MHILIIGSGRMGSAILEAWKIALPKKCLVNVVEAKPNKKQ